MNDRYDVEKVWTTKSGLTAVCIITKSQGKPMHRCGYVGVKQSSPLAGLMYDDVDAVVHGGLTYSSDGTRSNTYPIESNLYWFGFDCGHYGDIPIDPSLRFFQYEEFAAVRTEGYVIEQCESLADQLVQQERTFWKRKVKKAADAFKQCLAELMEAARYFRFSL